MHQLLKNNVFFVKEDVGMFKAASNYDIYDERKNLMMLCREPNLTFLAKMLRFTDYRKLTPFDVEITTPDGMPILRVKRDWTLFRSVVEVFDERGTLQGRFKQRLLSLGGKFDILDENDNLMCSVSGKWTAWEYTFTRNEQPIAQITKKWAGVGKELFTSADNYVVSIDPSLPENDETRLLILAAAVCVDKVFKE